MCWISWFAARHTASMVTGLTLLILTSQMGYHSTWASDEPTGPTRTTVTGPVQGYMYTLKSGKQVERYLGIPYAAPPVDDLRFKKPIPSSVWEDVLPANKPPPACIQERLETIYILQHNPEFDGRMSEDCLYINIYVPHNTSWASLPVLIHVHGGSNMVGMGAMLHGDVLASVGEIIVVSFNYRLGPFGFLYMPELKIYGNYGLFDQNLAFQWVKYNILYFGGDPKRITVQGHSAGAVDVGLHLLSPFATDLFQSAILQSGSPNSYWAVTFDSEDEDNVGRREKNLLLLGCAGMSKKKTLKCLLELDYHVLANKYFFFKRKIFNFSPAIDGVYIKENPKKILERMVTDSNLRPNCDSVMLGVTNDEGSLTAQVIMKNMSSTQVDFWTLLTGDLFSEFIGFKDIVKYLYTPWQDESNDTARKVAFSDFFGDCTFTAPAIKMADSVAAVKGTNVYVYNFNHISTQTTYSDWMGVPHGEDQFYIFGCPVENRKLRNYTQEDAEVSMKLMQLWGRFVHKQRNVSLPDESSQWPAYTKEDKNYLDISSEIRSGAFFSVRQSLRKKYVYFWNNVLPAMEFKQPKQYFERSEAGRGDYVLWILSALLCVFVLVSLVLFICLIYRLRDTNRKSVRNHDLIEDSRNSISRD